MKQNLRICLNKVKHALPQKLTPYIKLNTSKQHFILISAVVLPCSVAILTSSGVILGLWYK